MQEILEKRTINSKTFQNDDNTITSQIAIAPIHYLDDAGHFQDIDLNIKPEQIWEFEYSVKKNNFHAYFNDSTDINNHTLASFEIKNSNGVFRWINYKLYGANPTGNTIVGSSIKYTNVFSNIDLEYIVRLDRLKENIIIKQPVSNFTYTFTLKLSEGLRIEQQLNGSIFFIDTDTQEILWKIEKPYAIDSSNLRTENVTYTLGKQTYDGIEYDAVTVIIYDIEFLNNAVYPVSIDPTTTSTIATGIDDGYSKGTIFNNSNQYIQFGTTGFVNFLRFTNFPVFNGTLTDITLGVYSSGEYYGNVGNINIYANLTKTPVAPTTYTEVNNLIRTTSYVTWDVGTTLWTENSQYSTPSLLSLSNELKTSANWVYGDSIQLIFESTNGTTTRKFWSFESSTMIPFLTFTWSEAPSKIKIGAYKLMGKSSIITIPLYDPTVGMDGKNMLRTFLSDGTVACFELQDLVGNELIRVMGKNAIKGVKI